MDLSAYTQLLVRSKLHECLWKRDLFTMSQLIKLGVHCCYQGIKNNKDSQAKIVMEGITFFKESILDYVKLTAWICAKLAS